ncbi:protein YgfX [Thalassotalea piscium]
MKLVKIQNSMTWCNLYSVESKYKIEIQPSQLKALCWAIFTLMNFLFVFLFIEQIFQLSGIVRGVAFIITIIVSLYIFKYHKTRTTPLYYYLSENGELQWLAAANKRECWQITQSSRVAIYGCYLSLVPSKPMINSISNIDSISVKTRQLFFFKDNLNVADYARLCRVIRHINNIDA